MSRFQKWAVATTTATYLLIMAGGLVRAKDAGLGCPDWPKCFGRYYPPLSESQVPANIDPSRFDVQLAWIEYSNRLLGVLVGFLILGTFYYAVKDHRANKRIIYPTSTAFVLTLFQGWQGGQVVEQELKAWVVTVHLVLALVIVSLLLYATVGAFFPTIQARGKLPKSRQRLGQFALFLLLITLIQVGLGAKLRGDIEFIEENNPQIARAALIEEVGWPDIVHRTYSWLVLLGTGGILYYTHRKMESHAWILNTARLMAVMVIVQILTGIGMAYGGIPRGLQVIHLLNSSVLIGALTLLYLLINRLPVSMTTSDEAAKNQPVLSQEPVLR